MADAPWRCSQCGTVNEPVANACRTCGRWPSMFDLEESKVDEFDEVDDVDADVETSPEPQVFEPEIDIQEVESEPQQRGEPAEPESQRARRRRLLRRIIIPVAVVIYLVISNIVNR